MMQILPADRRGIPHHLLDILSPQEEFSAGDFYARARAATADILQVSPPCFILKLTCFIQNRLAYLQLSSTPCILSVRCLQNAAHSCEAICCAP